MAKIITPLLVTITIVFNASFAQKLDHDLTSPWFFGANVGGTWHHTDVKNKTHYGWGLVLGRTFNRNYANLFSYDLKFRYLGGAWRGQNTDTTGFQDYTNTTLSQFPTDYKTTYGYSINNFQTKAHEFNLELSVHLNRFTERTGLDPYIFGGIGATFFRTKGNLTDDMGFMYDYSLLSDHSKTSLSNFMDKTYESDLDGSHIFSNWEFMGHLGFGLGYYFTRNVALGFEHKTTFSRGDRFDGVFNDHGKYKKDIYHYTSLYLKIYFNRARIHEGSTPHPQPPANPTTPVNPTTPSPADCPEPSIFLQTAANSTVNQPLFQVSGSIRNASLYGINASHNGIQTGDFVYNSKEDFKGTFHLQPGLNTIILSASNSCGDTEQTIYVNYVPACDNPVVNFTNPRTANTTTTNPTVSVQAQIIHLGNGLAQLYVNGQQSTNFSYNSSTGILTSNVNLQNGNNTVQIIVSNSCGTNSQTIYIQYDRQCPTPLIVIKSPATNYGTSNRVDVSATIQNISNANQVDIYVNGQIQSVGAYQSRTALFTKTINLARGQNRILIRATNSCGTSEQTIYYEYGEPCLDPTVHITNPSGSRVSSNVSTYTIQAAVQNVTNPQNITFKVNNVVISNFNYNIQTGLFTAYIQLNNGSNLIELSAGNECGYAGATSTISYTPPCNKPVATWKQPTTNTTVSSEDFTIEATINGINSANDVSVSLNGVLQTNDGVYFNNTAVYRKSLKLQRGNNLIQLTANNYCGEATTSINVHYKGEVVIAGDKPVVAFTNSCGAKIAAGLIKFTGNVLGVTSTSQIQVKLQNAIQNGVIFKQTGSGFSFELEIRAGYSQTYVMEITASNHIGTTIQTCQLSTDDAPVIDKDIEICHTINGIKQTITIKESQWSQYQRLGATLGKCPVVIDNDMVICYSKGGQTVTLTIKESQWPNYQKLGATKGACPEAVDNDIIVCIVKGKERVTTTIKESEWAHYQSLGATLGKCPEIIDNDIIVCVPQGRIKVTMTIKESEWPQYQQMGATLGGCPVYDPEITICLREGAQLNTLTIKQSEWPDYQEQGATLGACPEIVDADITICLPDGKGGQSTLTIKQSQWAAYQAKGATLGACAATNVESESNSNENTLPSGGMLICVEENGALVTKDISPAEWKKYERLGATRGACVEDEGEKKTPAIQTPRGNTTITQPVNTGRTISQPTNTGIGTRGR